MGSIGGEELVKWEKMQGPTGRGEKILVLVRLRPLSEKETTANEVADWECINDTTILYRNTLREGSTFPSAHTFDRVFRGDCPTKQVYEEGAKEIALSVVNGINSTIFAYGQTSSGKTYTMVGITEYAVADIFNYISKHEERAFVVKFSAIEIYNEIVRDLLSADNSTLRLRDDPEKGTIVEKLTEETLRDWGHLKELLSFCEAQRQVGETYLNEKSSRSHQIIRLTIESSAREFLGKGNCATLSASVNFVDLAGSERASQALSAGTRLKEGCHINRSLLTLGTVIRKLSKGRHGHINYRDSKLTRLLQPCLGGNARTAVICTLSPARSHVEQTRNTLLFACCAKEVTTKAQVNVVMSDKALVKQLQKEVARLESELRAPAPPTASCDHAALLRKKDLQIEKMEKKIRELTQQLELAQSRIEDLLGMIDNDQKSGKAGIDSPQHMLGGEDEWEDDYSVRESLGISTPAHPDGRIRELSNPHHNNGDCGSNPEQPYHHSEGTEHHSRSDEFPDQFCKEVQCVEKEDSNRQNSEYLNPSRSENGGLELPMSEEVIAPGQKESTSVNKDREANQVHDSPAPANGAAEQRLRDVQMTVDSPVCPQPDSQSPRATLPNMSNLRNLNLSRSWSCREYFMTGSLESAGELESTPANGIEKGFPGRPERFRRNLLHLRLDPVTRLSRDGSLSTVGSPCLDSMRTPGNEGITSIRTFVAGMKEMVKLEYEKQLVDGQGKETERGASTLEKNVKEVGIDSMLEAPGTPLNWTLQFERQQKEIVELWHTCHVSLIHRTYFFLLFSGDPSDSIYMEVELRRLAFLKETFSKGSEKDSQKDTLASSMKTLRREREALVKLMQKRLTEEEREDLYEKWGIALESKRRRVQLVNLLWSNTNITLAKESANLIAKLLKFSEKGKALKEMFGLSFTPRYSKRRSFSWITSKPPLL
ncbi:kinesin-like protein KIN-7E [Neltuma alba]|uniref:kinesin-like protein KIN-7E n=1 Tax=Neltuma alba TaxID=207710 RepID=UPI0010A377D2|nr:kinesin-like protein KIN-7E [Prosopis alba]